jgi:hypothetical protein
VTKRSKPKVLKPEAPPLSPKRAKLAAGTGGRVVLDAPIAPKIDKALIKLAVAKVSAA